MRRLLLAIVLSIVVVTALAWGRGELQIWPKLPGVPNYGVGLPESVYGVHPVDVTTYGESYFFMSRLDDGTAIFATVFITNMGLSSNNTSMDVAVCEPGMKNYWGRIEFKHGQSQAAADHMDVTLDTSRVWGRFPDFNVKLDVKKLAVDLKYHSTLPGFAINSGLVVYGSPDHYYASYVSTPRAEVTGTIRTPAGARQVHGYGYSDHGRVTMMPHKYSKRWFSLRCFDAKYTLDILEFTVPQEWGGRTVPMIAFAKGDKLLYAGDRYTLTPSDWQTEPTYKMKYPKHFDFSLDRPGVVKVTGLYTVQSPVEIVNILERMSFFERQIAGIFAKSYVYRFLVNVQANVTFPDGTTDSFTSPAISEVLWIK